MKRDRGREKERVRERGGDRQTDKQRYTQGEQVFRSRITAISRSNIRNRKFAEQKKVLHTVTYQKLNANKLL